MKFTRLYRNYGSFASFFHEAGRDDRFFAFRIVGFNVLCCSVIGRSGATVEFFI